MGKCTYSRHCISKKSQCAVCQWLSLVVTLLVTSTKLLYLQIFSRLDYCNVILSGLPLSTIAPLQRVQNAAARLLMGLLRRDHVRSALKELHWLPVVYRIKFKLALMMFTIHTRQCPDYLSSSVQACNVKCQCQSNIYIAPIIEGRI